MTESENRVYGSRVNLDGEKDIPPFLFFFFFCPPVIFNRFSATVPHVSVTQIRTYRVSLHARQSFNSLDAHADRAVRWLDILAFPFHIIGLGLFYKDPRVRSVWPDSLDRIETCNINWFTLRKTWWALDLLFLLGSDLAPKRRKFSSYQTLFIKKKKNSKYILNTLINKI